MYSSTVSVLRQNLTATYSKTVRTIAKSKETERKAALERAAEKLPLRQNFTDDSDPPLWSFTFFPRDWMYVGDSGLLEKNLSAYESTVRIQDTVHDVSNASSGLLLTENSPPGYGVSWFAYGNTSYAAEDVEEYGNCLPTDSYIWGFSSLMLFTFCMITIAFALLLITLHYDAYLNSAADRYKLSISPYRDVLDLAEELRAHYGSAETAEMPAKELDRAMREDPVATGLETETLHRSRRTQWKQAKASKKAFTRNDARKRSKTAESQAGTNAEESLVSMGLDAQLYSEMEMAKLPARVASRSTNGT
jgi:hypothetical protein